MIFNSGSQPRCVKGTLMRREVIASARQLSSDLRNSENDYDLALASNARFLASLLDARRNAGLPAATGREAVECGFEALTHGAKARQMLVGMHEELAKLDLRELATGDLSECPEDWAIGRLSIVPPAGERDVA